MAARRETYGEGVPFGDPYWYQGMCSPYYDETHIAFRQRVRSFVEKEILPHADEWDQHGYPYKELHPKAYDAGILGSIYPKELGGTPPEGTEKADMFHELILWDELSRCGTIPAAEGILGQASINSMALPPVINYGSQHMREMVARPVIRGEKMICLAISEPTAGSDVANIKTEAIREGDHYLVNGQKKWITGGLWADWFTLCCRTGGPGGAGLSLLLVPAKSEGISVRRLETQGSAAHHTSFISLEDVRVPVENLIGEEGKGFRYVLENFNHERFILAVGANRGARVCLEEAMRYARVRKTFGKRLVEHPVIRSKLADMAQRVESCHDSLERVAYQFSCGIPDSSLGGACALLKVQATTTFEFCAREASQVFGGSSVIKEGKGKLVERLYREVRAIAIPGGSEEIMRDLAIREAIKQKL